MRSKKLPLPDLYQDAESAILKMCFDVFYKMVDVNFTLDDVVNWCVDKDSRAALTAAYAMTSEDSKYWGVTGALHLDDGMCLRIRFKEANMFTPLQTFIKAGSGGPDTKGIMDTCLKVLVIHNNFAKVRQVVNWLNQHRVTPGAARYYWPTILTLLPETHAVHKSDGQRYREPAGISEVLELMRESSAIVASALMLGDFQKPLHHSHITLSIQSASFPLI